MVRSVIKWTLIPVSCSIATHTPIPSPNVGANSDYLNGVDAIASNDVWAVGYYWDSIEYPTRTLVMHWNGNRWNHVPTPNVGTGGNFLYAVAAISANDVWAVGQYYSIPDTAYQTLIMHWDGTQWSHVPSPNAGTSNTNYLFSVAAISANDVWAVGSADVPGLRRTLTLHWDGSSWSIVPSPNPGPAQRLNAVTALASNDAWAVGGYDTGNGLIRTLTLHWNGSEWSQIPSPNVSTISNLRGVAAISSDDVWAIGYENSYNYRTLTLHWDGNQWTHVRSPNVNSNSHDLRAVAVVSPGEAWAVGNYMANIGSGLIRTLAMRYSDPCVTPTPTVTGTPPTATPTYPPASCPNQFTDVPPGSTFYPYVRCMACRGIITGYSCGGPGEPCTPLPYPYFRPNADVTRGQLAKIVSNSAGFNEPLGSETFEDVSGGNAFLDYIERLVCCNRNIVSGYPCGGPGEPCGPGNKPYFRPNANATRGQISKIVANAAEFYDPPQGWTFQDVPPDNTFYVWVQRLASRGIMGGYECGAPGEPCIGPENRPYFRPGNNATRGQVSKIVANTFFPGCNPP